MSTTSTTSSQSTAVLHKVFIAGCRKQFVGKGAGQFTKDEIKELDIVELANTIESEVGDFRKPTYCGLNQSITYFLGLCRIYEKAVTFLHEDVIELNEKLDTFLYGTEGVSSKKKKSKKETAKKGTVDFELDDLESVQSLKLCEDIDLISFFERAGHNLKTDKNLLTEVDVHWAPLELPDFGDEIHLQNGHLTDVIEGIHAGPSGIAPSVSGESIGESSEQPFMDPNAISAVSIGNLPSRREKRNEVEGSHSIRTPKRKMDKSNDDTPSKRQRKSTSVTDPSDKKGAASRRLFNENEPRPLSPGGEAVRQDKSQRAEETFNELLPMQNIEEEPPSRISIQINVEPPPDNEVDREPEQSVPDASSQNVQQLPDTSHENLDDIQLEELDDESLASKRRRAKRKTIFKDKEKQIEKFDYSNIEKFTNVHTKKMEIPNLEEVERKSKSRLLFLLPATGIKRKGPCTWGRKLLDLYLERAVPVLRLNEEPRDANVDKRLRSQTLEQNSGWGALEPPTPEVPNVTTVGISDSPEAQDVTSDIAGDISKDRDRELMPPPRPRSQFDDRPMLSRPSDDLTSLPTLGQSYDEYDKPPSLPASPKQQSPRHQTQRSPISQHVQPSISAVSPRQLPRVQTPFLEGTTAEEQSLPSAVPMSPSMSAKERSILMKEDEFYNYLEDLWVKSFFKVDLDDIIVPHRSTLTKFYRYFGYLQRFQSEKKLTMVQKIIYGPVQIIKGIEE